MKLIRWFGRWLAVALFITLVTVMTTWYMVNAYVDSLLRYFEINPEHVRIPAAKVLEQIAKDWNEASGMVKQDSPLTGAEGGLSAPPEEPPGETVLPDGNSNQGDDDGGAASSNPEGEQALPQEQEKPAVSPPDAMAVWGQIDNSQEAGVEAEEIVISMETFNRMKDAISDEDKQRILAIVSQLPQETIQEISFLMENGVTKEEMMSIQNMVKAGLSGEHFEELMEILRKY